MHITKIFIFMLCYITVNACYVTLSDNGPVVSGASITFVANVYKSGDIFPFGTLEYEWSDNAMPAHSQTFTGEMTNSTWTVSFPKEKYIPGIYEVQIKVYKKLVIDFPLCSNRKFFNITSYLNGYMELKQNNSTMHKYVSTSVPVEQNIILDEADAQFLRKNTSSILTYWFVDCVYHGVMPNMSFIFSYTDAGQMHSIQAVVVASHESPLTTTPITSSAASITTTVNTPSTPTSVMMKKGNASSIDNAVHFAHLTTFSNDSYENGTISNEIIEDLNNHSELVYIVGDNNRTDLPNEMHRYVMPPGCSESVVPDPKKTYGYFSNKIIPKAPVSDVKVEGNAWLQHGELLTLEVSCNGTGPFSYCMFFKSYVYNVTGNESCPVLFTHPSCGIPIRWYLSQSTTYTLVLIIQNDVNKIITPVGINIYEVTKHAQLSVIIVPVSASIVAVISIIFGVAYYVQSKRRYTIEVADFDFSHASDLEYKTFYERLLESVSNAFNKEEEYSEQDSICAGPTSRKYGNMQ